jgi:hypothetical protein
MVERGQRKRSKCQRLDPVLGKRAPELDERVRFLDACGNEDAARAGEPAQRERERTTRGRVERLDVVDRNEERPR